ncbi:Multidrug resistance protein MdtA [Pseudomonas sp. MM227]|uniref:MdtA/MuxA family multidrug efflux RND transporter periplasmic adaptor subunit n=1 Tax=unclassified Pseudomonas TaxID=196821 RepID=UPI00177E115A|nr:MULTISPECIES: MdtA/MuxA family multidrug efflux RND transporter periplasmic adaptor subunit [unclassified Pseudomonas]MBD8602612.1 MdtA/MuxA family multidrug efflux RND transporter periplasmic adaptor subunit [Pseudomonas sp. CFBP 8771]MBD8624780.1 MdtA/MuxA family multidrug efflux RND transporter periplasmic adaptor subunit [Pseudomonas sp. CFBP 13727]MBD8824868.1 MdtA/MuxA family multidrug efflux RND transporter periplasmic adaptor subunit [Pseudomonas sp. CFBP 13602]CAI3788547.1 Multidrug
MVDHSMQSPGPRKSRRWLFGLLMVVVVAVLCWWFWPATKNSQNDAASAPAAGRNAGAARPGFGGSAEPTPVRVAEVITGDFPVYYKALGTVTATNTVNVRSRVAGELIKVNFQEGQRVKAGDLLAEIDPRSYEIALQQAQGTLAQNQAQLKNAQIDLQRYKGLFAEDSIARQTLDTQQALVGQYQGTIQTNQAAVNDAKLNLDFTRIRAPIAGRLGLRQLDIGNLVAANDTNALVVITQVQPITVAFTLPESQLTPVLARYRSGAKLAVEAWDRGDTRKQATGVLGSLDNQIDTTTGTLKFKARFENQDEALFPNQFVNVRLLSDTLKGVVLVPSAAVQYGVDGTFVYAMDGNDKVKIRQLKVGATDGSNTVVEQGLAQGDRVVLEGTDRLRDGSRVEVVDDSAKVPTSPGQHLQGQDGAAVPGTTGKTGA